VAGDDTSPPWIRDGIEERPAWYGLLPDLFNQTTHAAMVRVYPVAAGKLEAAPLKARNAHKDRLAAEERNPVNVATEGSETLLTIVQDAKDLDVQDILDKARELSPKALQAINLIRRGHTPEAIADELRVTDRTIRNWLAKIRQSMT